MVGSIDTPNNWSRLPLSPGDGGRLLKNGAALIPRLSHAEVIAENIGLRPVRKWGVRLEYEEIAPDQSLQLIAKIPNRDYDLND